MSSGKTNTCSFHPQCRVIVDDVDDDTLHPTKENERHKSFEIEERCESSENPTARIKQIQVEAESRKMEFARLLEEHAQVVKTLKQMEQKEMDHLVTNSVANATKA